MTAAIATLPTPPRMQALLPAEAANLHRLEGVIRRGMKSFMEVGSALFEIREQRLYRATHATFEEYCRDRWGFSRQTASRHILAADVVSDLSPTGDKEIPLSVYPENERQVRPLARLEPEQRREAWKEATGAAGGGQPSARLVEEAAERIAPRSGTPEPDEPADVLALRQSGAIPAGAAVEVSAEPGDDEIRPAAEPAEAELSDAGWLETLPARASLADHVRVWFDAEALAYRRITPIRRQYRDQCRRHTNAAKKDGKGHIGPWISLHDFYLRQPDPGQWQACKECGGTARVELVGKCPACKGHGYHTH